MNLAPFEPDPFDDDDPIQRIMNQKKRDELSEKYGASFGETNPELSPYVENEWLNYIEEFERQFENAERITLRQYLGFPIVKPLSEIPPTEISAELDKLFDLLYEHQVSLDTLCEVEDAELYRFIVEELLDTETDDIRIPGTFTCYTYEEFHPNDEYDIKMWAEDFVKGMLDGDLAFHQHRFSKKELYDANGAPTTLEEAIASVTAFRQRNPKITDIEIKPVTWKIEGDYASVDLATSWNTRKKAQRDTILVTGRATVRLKRSPYAGWDVIQARIPGWSDLDLQRRGKQD